MTIRARYDNDETFQINSKKLKSLSFKDLKDSKSENEVAKQVNFIESQLQTFGYDEITKPLWRQLDTFHKDLRDKSASLSLNIDQESLLKRYARKLTNRGERNLWIGL